MIPPQWTTYKIIFNVTLQIFYFYKNISFEATTPQTLEIDYGNVLQPYITKVEPGYMSDGATLAKEDFYHLSPLVGPSLSSNQVQFLVAKFNASFLLILRVAT